MRKKNMNGSRILKGIFGLAVFFGFFGAAVPETVFGQKNCGREGQRPCKIWERIPSCNKGLKEHFKLNMCVGPRTQVNVKGQYIPRKESKETFVRMCNRSSRPMIYAAIAYWTYSDAGWASHGWLRIPSENCETFELGEDYSGAVYIYGSSDDSTVWDGTSARFCIKTYDAFDIDNSERIQCRSREYSIVGMQKFAVRPGTNKFNFGD
jgi:uncharacterized membrane protein